MNNVSGSAMRNAGAGLAGEIVAYVINSLPGRRRLGGGQ